MLIDWFTVAAQVVNFLILVWLLKRFLYRPILDAIDAREKRIAKELADADSQKAEAQKEHVELLHKNEAFDQQRAGLLSKATEEAQAERQRILDEARKAADAVAAKRQEALHREQQSLSEALSRRARDEVFAIARKALGDLATTTLEDSMCEVFTRRLRELDVRSKAGFGAALKSSFAPGLVRTSFDLSAEQRTVIRKALNEIFSAEIRLQFETAPDLVSGIELTSNGQKIGWSITDYLGSLEKGVDELLKEKFKPQAKAEPRPEAKVEPKTEVKPEPKSEAKVEPKPEVNAEPKREEPKSKAETQ